MTKLSSLADIDYGNKLDLNRLPLLRLSEGGINFVGRSSRNSGVTATVKPIAGLTPNSAGLITVALGGSRLLASFVQQREFYTAQNVAVLTPKIRLSFEQKIFLCLCIRRNRFRYSAFGREANRSLKDLIVPNVEEFPRLGDASRIAPRALSKPEQPGGKHAILDVPNWRPFLLSKLFRIEKGKRITKAEMRAGATPFVGASDRNNGVTAWIDQSPLHDGNTISLSYNGSVGEAFYQDRPYWCSDDVNALYPRFEMNAKRALYLVTLIRREGFRFSYGRKWNLERMEESTIWLPVTSRGEPDWPAIDRYVSQLQFSSQLPKSEQSRFA